MFDTRRPGAPRIRGAPGPIGRLLDGRCSRSRGRADENGVRQDKTRSFVLCRGAPSPWSEKRTSSYLGFVSTPVIAWGPGEYKPARFVHEGPYSVCSELQTHIWLSRPGH